MTQQQRVNPQVADRPWPRWRPGQELRVTDLLGLEDFLLARSRILDEDAHGIESFDWVNGMSVTAEGAARTLHVGNLRGVTPAGEPVVCEAGSSRLSVVLDRNGPEHDVWISVDAEGGSGEADGDLGEEPSRRRPKVSLIASAAPTPHILPFAHPHRLYLGRYVFPEQPGPDPIYDKTMTAEPFVRRLGALQPRDVDWQSWIGPLRLRIGDLGRRAFENGLADTALGVELLRLQFEWAALPLPALIRRLRFIRWLAKSPPEAFPSFDLGEAVTGDAAVERLKAERGHTLPKYLADLLPSPEDLPRRVREAPGAGAPPASASPPPSLLGDALKLLLEALGTGGIGWHAPLEAIEIWRDRIAAQRAIRSGGVDLAAAVDLASLGPGTDPWVRASVLISLAAIEAGGGSASGTNLLLPFRDITGGSAAQKAASALEQLYSAEAASNRAGPIAFFVLANAAKDTVGDPKGKTGAFLAALRGAKLPNAPPEDRVAAYLRDIRAQGRRWPTVQLPAPGRLGRILLLGRPSSGRKSLKQALLAACAGAAALDIQVLAHGEALPSPTIGRTDVLVAVIEPALLSDPDVERHVADLKALLGHALGSAPSLRFALTFSKADEYGVFTPDTSGLHTPGRKVPDPRARDQHTKGAWRALREGGSAGGEQRFAGGAVIGTGGSPGSRETRPTRAWIVDQTRPLWELAVDRPGAFVTARLTTCRPLDSRFDPDGGWSTRKFLADLHALD